MGLEKSERKWKDLARNRNLDMETKIQPYILVAFHAYVILFILLMYSYLDRFLQYYSAVFIRLQTIDFAGHLAVSC